MKHKTAKISDLIHLLQETIEEYGNLPIVLASDSEINSVGTINTDNTIEANITEEGGIAILFPHAEGLYLEDVSGYREEQTSDDAYTEDEEDPEELDPEDDYDDLLETFDNDDE